MARATHQSDLDTLLKALFRGELTEAQALQLAALGPEAVQLALLAANDRFAQLQPAVASPSTPSGMRPIYTKPKVSGRRKTHAARRPANRQITRPSRRVKCYHFARTKKNP